MARRRVDPNALVGGSVQVWLPEPLRVRLENFIVSEGHPNVAVAVREFIERGLASSDLDGVIAAARARAYNDVKGAIIRRMIFYLGELQVEMRTWLSGAPLPEPVTNSKNVQAEFNPSEGNQ